MSGVDGTPAASARFIAGAVCPKCRALDRIRVWGTGDEAVRECIDCGYRSRVKGVAARVVGGKFDQSHDASRNSCQATTVQSVKIIPDPDAA